MTSKNLSHPTFRQFARALLMIISLVPLTVHGFSNAPPNGKTGAPGEGTCHDCHGSFDLNSGSGGLIITGPDEFEANETYEILISLEQTGQTRWGFEFSPLDIGTCTITDTQNTQLDISEGKTYVKHTSAGTFAGDTPFVVWEFEWTAPADPPEDVTFYAAGNAADNDGSTGGDYIYTTSVTSSLLQTGAGIPLPATTLALDNSPNPFGSSTTISYHLPSSGKITLSIYDSRGMLVKGPHTSMAGSGTNRFVWDGTDGDNHAMPSGVYVCRLSTNGGSVSRRLVLAR